MLHKRTQTSLTPYLFQAIFFYFIFFVLAFAIQFFWQKFIPKPVVSAPAIKVSVVAMPQKNQKKLPQKNQKKLPQKNQKKLPQKNQKKLPTISKKIEKLKRQQSKTLTALLRRKRAAAAKQKNEAAAAKQKNEAAAATQKLNRGNILSEGTSLSGVQKIKFNSYVDDITAEVKSNWALPSWIKRQQSLRAEVLVKIAATGNVLSIELSSASSNNIFNNSTLEAIRQAAPFPYPPDEILLYLSNTGVTFIFP